MHIAKKKSLGQNFLRSKRIAARIADTANLSENDTVLEIGPGGGILTAELLARAGWIIAIEKDHRLIASLRDRFAREIRERRLRVVEADALTTTPQSLGLKAGAYKVVANIPYYITGALIAQLLSGSTQPSCAVLLVQKEVGERIAARDGKESLLSVSVKAYGTPRIVANVLRGNFKPAPRVDSAILLIEHISKQFFSEFSEQEFFSLVKTGFAHKRKLLARNLEPLFESHDAVQAAFSATGLAENVRAEDVSLDQWRALAEQLPGHGHTA